MQTVVLEETMHINTVLPATFSSRVNNSDCTLELHLNADHRLMGFLRMNGETLEVYGGIANSFGEVFGLLSVPGSEQPVAVFRANFLGPALLEFEIDQPGAHDLMALENAERFVFTRVESSSPALASNLKAPGRRSRLYDLES
jgi:hypothetical protein